MHKLEYICHNLVLIGEGLKNLLHEKEFLTLLVILVFFVSLLLPALLICCHIRLELVLLLLIKSHLLVDVFNRFAPLGLIAETKISNLINKTQTSLNDLVFLFQELRDTLVRSLSRSVVSMHDAKESLN